MKTVLISLLLSILFSARAQDEAHKIVKEYSRGEGPTHMNNGLGSLNSETHYDKEGRIIRMIQFSGYEGYKSREIITSYYRGSEPKTITTIVYPKGFRPGTISVQSLPADHPHRKPDTTVQQCIYGDTLLLRTDYFKNGKLFRWVEYRYNEDGYEIESAEFNGNRANRGKWLKTARDQMNRPVKIQELRANGSVEYTETKTYDEGGLLKINDYESGSSAYHTVTKFTYNSDGLLTKEIREVLSPEDKKDVITSLHNYNAKGLLIQEGRFDSLGKVKWEKTHEYNSSGQKIKTQFSESVRYYKYNEYGDLVSIRFENNRSEVQSAKRFIYEMRLLKKTEHYNSKELTDYTQNYYSERGNLIRQERMRVQGKEALQWIKYFDYDGKDRLIRMNHKQPDQNHSHRGISVIEPDSQKSQPKTDLYKNYVDQYTYYTYDDEGRQVNVYHQGGERTRITQLEGGKFGIFRQTNSRNNMVPSTSVQVIDRLDTVKIETPGKLKIITLKLDYIESPYRQSSEEMTHYHKNLIREETFNTKGELIALKEITEDGILLYSSDENETKSLSTHNRYTRSKAEQFRYGRFTFDQVSTTFYNPDSLEYLVAYTNKDSVEFIYENGRLSREIKKHGNGHYGLTSYEYDKNGFKTRDRICAEDGVENFRVVYENNRKHIISEQHIYLSPNHETLYEITYLNP